MISGYVGIYSNYRISNILFLWCRVVFYSITITLLSKCFVPSAVSIKDILSSLIPTVSGKYWYFTSYALLFLFIPILNEGLKRLSKRTLALSLISIIIIVSVIQPFANVLWGDNSYLSGGYSTWWLMILYLIGGYIRKYNLFKTVSRKNKLYMVFYLAFVLLTLTSKIIIRFASKQIWGEIKYDNILISYQSITILGAAVSLLLAFEKAKLRSHSTRIICFFTPLAFSVYLIHDHPQIRELLITDHFVWIGKLPMLQMILCIFGIAFCVFFTSSIIDLFRHHLFKVIKLKEKLQKIDNRIKNIRQGEKD